MKIISKYKDYYDYLQGIYGVDEKLILDRRSSEHPMYYQNGVYQFIIGELIVEVLHVNGKFYCGESDMIKIGGQRNEYKSTGIVSYYINSKSLGEIEGASIRISPIVFRREKGELKNPAIYLSKYSGFQEKIYPFPRLSQYNIQKVLSPHNAWVELSA